MARGERISIGRPDVSPSKPSHTKGVREGNARGSYDRMPGHHPQGTSDARRSTGIDPETKNPIVPGAPNLSPP